MDATDYRYSTSATNTWDITSTSAWGTVGGDCTTAAFGISPTIAFKKPLLVPNKDWMKDVPRIHKDKNGCVKKAYWETQPIDIKDLGGLGFNVASGDAFTISTSGVANMTMGDIDAAQGVVCDSYASA